MRVAPIMNDVAVRLLIGVRERLAGLAKACGGATAVETAIVLPVFLLLLFGVIEAGLLFWTQSTLQSAVEAAARCAVVDKTNCGSTSDVQSYAASQAIGMTVASSSFNVSQPSCGYQVSISYNFSFIVSGLFPGMMTLNAKSCHPT
jgi:Flp pilus assembly protein TadG